MPTPQSQFERTSGRFDSSAGPTIDQYVLAVDVISSERREKDHDRGNFARFAHSAQQCHRNHLVRFGSSLLLQPPHICVDDPK